MVHQVVLSSIPFASDQPERVSGLLMRATDGCYMQNLYERCELLMETTP